VSISEDAHVHVLVADHVALDAGGKITALGAYFSLAGVDPEAGLSAPQHVVVIVDVPSKYRGQDFAVSIELRDMTEGKAFLVPGPDGPPQALRVQQVMRAAPPTSSNPSLYLPQEMPSRVQATLAFPNGLPLRAGHFYRWRVEIDGQHRKGWHVDFYVPGPPPGPVFGGAAGPADVNLPKMD
jgi:hypothetical protein